MGDVRLIRQGMSETTRMRWSLRETFEGGAAVFWLDFLRRWKAANSIRGNCPRKYMLPASLPGEKEGTFTNLSRLVQWHDKVVESRAIAGRILVHVSSGTGAESVVRR